MLGPLTVMCLLVLRMDVLGPENVMIDPENVI